MSVASKVYWRTLFLESVANALANVSTHPHVLEYPPPGVSGFGSGEFESGTGTDQFDIAWSGRRAVASGTPDTGLDLRGGLTSLVNGATLNFVDVCGIAIINESRTAAQNLV